MVENGRSWSSSFSLSPKRSRQWMAGLAWDAGCGRAAGGGNPSNTAPKAEGPQCKSLAEASPTCAGPGTRRQIESPGLEGRPKLHQTELE